MLNAALSAKNRLKFEFPYATEEWLNTMGMPIENYHKHTTWSNLIQIDSATSIEDFMRKSDENGCKCFFSGEHGYQGEWMYIYDVCHDQKKTEKLNLSAPLKFRYSTEAYWVKDRKEKDRTNCHIVLVARTYHAIRKLNYILSMASIDGFYGKPRLDFELLFQLDPQDVYVTSACLAGWKYEDAPDIWLNMWKHFGDSFFLEYQTHNTEEQKKLNRIIQGMSQEHGIQTIIGLDTHYLDTDDMVKRSNLLARKGQHYDDENGWYMDFPSGSQVFQRMQEQQVLSEEEILYSMMNTQVFLNGCEETSLSTMFKIPIAKEYAQYSYEERVKILQKILDEEYQKEDDEHRTSERYSGMEYEFEEIKDSTTGDYFLTNHTIINTATSPEYGGVLTTTSRGSASSYYCSKLLGFTTIDRFEAEVPIYPERFITKERIISSHQMPDIDYNCEAQDPFVLATRYHIGEESCYPLLAVGKLGEKSGFKLYADIKGIEPSIANEVSKGIEQYNEAMKMADDDEDKENIHIEDYIEPQYLGVFNDSKPYQGIIEQSKVHACGFFIFNGDHVNKDVIGYGDIRYEIGLIRCHSESTGKSVLVACVEGNLLDAYGYVKNDYLIVDVVGIIHKLYTLIGMPVPTVNQLRKMVDNDDLTWGLYAKGATCCLNQCERPATTKRVMKYKPQTPKELSAFIAAIRPGFKSLLEGFLSRIEYTNGEPAIDKLLQDSFCYMLYQEAVMKIFAYLGIPMKDSYDTIKKISKKKLKGAELEKVENNLHSHWQENIGNDDNFEPVYKVVKDSARYSFNAPHALAMAFDSLYEAWVKAHYPSVFYEVTLNHYQDKDDKNKIAMLVEEATSIFGYKMGTYEYGKDNSNFTVDDAEKTIYPSMSSIKGIGKKAVQDMMSIHASGADNFIDICCAIRGTKVNNSTLDKLVKIGYFKRYGSIKKLLKSIEIFAQWKGNTGDGRKTISKANIDDLGLRDIDIYKFATDVTSKGKISDKQFTNVDWVGLAKELSSNLPNEEFGAGTLAKFQYEVLGYVDYVDPSIDKRFALITSLDTTFSPRFKGYCLNNGKSVEMKIHKQLSYRDKTIKTSYSDCPVEDGDLLYLKSCSQKPKKKKIDGEWVTLEDTLDWWVNDYIKIEVDAC